MTTSLRLHMSGTSAWASNSEQAGALASSRGPIWAPRPAEGLESQQKTMPKTPELTQHGNGSRLGPSSHGWSNEVWAERCGGSSTPCASSCSTSGTQGVETTAFQKTFLRTPNRIFWKKTRGGGERGQPCWKLGDGEERMQVADGVIVPLPRDEGWRRRGSGREVLKLPSGSGQVQSGDALLPGGQRRVLVLLGPLGGCWPWLFCRAKDEV